MTNNSYYLFEWHNNKFLAQKVGGKSRGCYVFRVPSIINNSRREVACYISNRIFQYKKQKFIEITDSLVSPIPLLKARLLIDDNKLLSPMEFDATENLKIKIKKFFSLKSP